MPDFHVHIQIPGQRQSELVEVWDVANTAIAIYLAGSMAEQGASTPSSVIAKIHHRAAPPVTSPRDPAAGLLETLSVDAATAILVQAIEKCRKAFGRDDTAGLLSILGEDMVEAPARHTLKQVLISLRTGAFLNPDRPDQHPIGMLDDYLEAQLLDPAGLYGDGSGTSDTRTEGE